MPKYRFLLIALVLAVTACDRSSVELRVVAVPTNVSATALENSVRISWTYTDEVDSFVIYRQLQDEGQRLDAEELATVSAELRRYDDSSAVPGMFYRYSVAAVLDDGESAAVPQSESVVSPQPETPEPETPEPETPEPETPEPTEPETPEPAVPLACSGDAVYTLSFNSSWSVLTHPDMFPVNPHFSGLIGAVHNTELSLWSSGDLATAGIKNVAELGSKDPLNAEIDAAIVAGTASSKVSAGGIEASPGSVSATLTVTPDHSRLSVVSMLAPSPDWFVGLNGLELCEDGRWANKVVDAFVYDSGTDSGATYTAANAVTSPAEPIFRITDTPFLVDSSVTPVGTFVLRKQ